MVCINVLVLGLYHAMGWQLGAIEGVSITVLVGLSVDFCIHFSEAFVQSRLELRTDRAQCVPPLAPFVAPSYLWLHTAYSLLQDPSNSSHRDCKFLHASSLSVL